MNPKYMLILLISLLLWNCTNNAKKIEAKRSQFYQEYYNNPLTNINMSFDDFMTTIIAESSIVTMEVNAMLKSPVEDKLKGEREQYLKSNYELPDYIRDAVKNRRFIQGMTEYEFWLSLGDSTVLVKRIFYVDETNFVHLLESKKVPYRGRIIEFIDGYLHSFGET